MNDAGPEAPTVPEGAAVPERAALGAPGPSEDAQVDAAAAAGDEDGATTLLGAVIDAEVAAIERGLALVGLWGAGIGSAVALFVALTTQTEMAWPLVGVAAFGVAYFAAVRGLLRRWPELTVLRWATPVVEQLFPFVITVILIVTQGAAYALGSWVPPIVFVGMLVLNVARLRPAVAAAMGAVGAALFALSAFVLVPWLDKTPLPDNELYSARMQLTRCFTLLVTGGMGALGGWALRRVLGHGASRMRSHELFGKYRLGPQIAVGGMGRVLQATYCPEGGFERKVAIKQIHEHLALDARFVDAFRREAELCARLNHPNIVQVLDFGRAAQTYFFAMEFVDGANLGQLLARARAVGDPPTPGVAAFIAHEVGEALHFAHAVAQDADGERLRVIHRDLSPRNVLVARSGQVKLTDFGIARALKDAGSHQTRHMMGSLAYFAPEQVEGDALDERTDLFAFGVLLYELLTLTPLFERENDAATLRAVLEAPVPDVAVLRPELTPGWGPLLARALARPREERFQSAAEMNAQLLEVLEREGVPGPHEVRDWVARLLVAPVADGPEDEVTALDRPRART